MTELHSISPAEVGVGETISSISHAKGFPATKNGPTPASVDRFRHGFLQDTPLDNEQALYNYLATVSGPRKRVTPGVSTTRVRDGHDLYGSYHFARFYYPVAVRDTLRRFRMFQAPSDMRGWTVYEFGCCIGALSLECVRRGANVRAWEYNPAKVLGCQRLAEFLRLSPDQVSFFQQDLRAWLSDPAAAHQFAQRFAPADLTICCAVNIYIPKYLRLELYRFLARASRRLCWFESNSGETRDQIAEQLLIGGFQHVSYVGNCGHRHVFVASTSDRPANANPVRVASPGHEHLLTHKQHARLAAYTQAFLADPAHSRYFDQNPGEILESLANPNRLSIALMPTDRHISSCKDNRAVSAWYYKYVKRYSSCHKAFLNKLSRSLKAKLYTAKLLRHPREANLRNFLAALAPAVKKSGAEDVFFDGLDLNKNLLKQGVRVWDCHDYSSGRGYDEGAIVNRLILSRKGKRLAIFLKGLGKNRKTKAEARGISCFENFEVTALKAANIVGLNTIECKRYRDDADTTMVGYTLFQEIEAINTNHLFSCLRHRFALQPAYVRFRARLIREFGRIAAFCDLLRKGDRKIVQSIHPEYDANCLVNLDLLRKRSRRSAVWAIDFNHLFQSDNREVLHDIKHGKCAEIGIVSAFPEFYSNPTARSKLLKIYKKAYLAHWARILRKRQALKALISKLHGRRSLEYRIFRESLAADPRAEFRAQKAALLRAVAKETHPAKSRNEPYRLIGYGLHGRVFKLSSKCCIKVFRSGKHAEIERRAYEAGRGCRFIPKLYEAGPNYIIIEYVRGESLKDHLKRTGHVSAALTKQILSLIPELKRIGFTWTNFAIRHFILTTEGQLKVIDLKNAYDRQIDDVPYMLLKSLSHRGLRDGFLRRVDRIDPSLGSRWRRASSKNPAVPVTGPRTALNNGTENLFQTVATELGVRPHVG